MALNWTMLAPDRTPVPLPHELNIRTISSGVDLTVIIPDAPPTGSSASGGSGGGKRLKETGSIVLTDQRLIFVSSPTAGKPSFDSLTIPLTGILGTKFEQPYFGQNFLIIEIKPTPEGGLTSGTKAEIRMRDKGLFEFVSVLEKTRERAIYMKRQMADEEEGLPGYTSPADVGPSRTPLVVPDDAPPGYEASI